jgi:hypothetical protein
MLLHCALATSLAIAAVATTPGPIVDPPNNDRRTAAAPLPRPAADDLASHLGPGFRPYESAHFRLLSDGRSADADRTLRVLERTRHQFLLAMRRLGVGAEAPSDRLLCIMFDERDRFRAFARETDGIDPSWVGGYFAPDANRVVLFNVENTPELLESHQTLDAFEQTASERRRRGDEAKRARRDRDAERLRASARQIRDDVRAERRRLDAAGRETHTARVIHECAHLLAFNCGVLRPDRPAPFWLSEGLAMSFETTDTGAAFGPGLDGSDRLDRFVALRESGELMPLRELVRLDHVADPDRAGAMYAQSHALFTYLYRHERRALAGFFAALRENPPASPTDFGSMFERQFGDPDALERRLGRFVSGG